VGGRPPARGSWGWHQLDDRWAQRLVDDAGVGRGDLVVDVGAGTGALTAPLLRAGARVIAVEVHPGRAAELRRRFGDDVVVVRADAADLRLPRRAFHVVANPPFAVTAALLRRLLHPGGRLLGAHLVLQEQAVRRWVAADAPGIARWGAHFELGAGARLPRHAFTPRPRVATRVLTIRRR